MYIGKTKGYFIYNLRRAMKRGRLFNVESVPRGIGKTQRLVELAEQMKISCRKDIVIVQPDLQRVKFFKNQCRDQHRDIKFITASDVEFFRGFRGWVLIDEGLTPEQDKWIRQHSDVLGGYTGNSGKVHCYYREGVVANV